MKDNEKKTLEERKEGFKAAADQTVPVMGLGPENEPVAAPTEEDVERDCRCGVSCVEICNYTCFGNVRNNQM